MYFRGLIAALLTALVATAPAQAGSSAAPGLAKKQPTTVSEPAPAPVATTPAPTPTVAAPQGKSPAHATTPVNSGTIKKITRTQTTAASAAPVATGTTGQRATPRHRAAPPQRTAARSTSRRAHSTQPRVVSAAPAKNANGSHSSAAQRVTAPTASVKRARRSHAAPKRAAHRAASAARTQTKDAAPLTSISRAADRVIEVIPGAVVLALAGLLALVFLLILRSWAMERTRSRALEQSYGVTVEALATAIEAKDHTTGGHIERVRRLGLLLAAEIAPRESRDPQMAYGFLLHDIGKLAVPDAILRAPGRLTDEQWALMRRHPEEGVRMLATIPFLDRALDVVRCHHERWDGGGYPAGLRGTEIPLWARIFAVVDALDAITADRPYRPGRAYAAAVEEIQRHSGTQFDPIVVDALVRLDAGAVEPLLEPTQLIDQQAAEVVQLGPLVAA